MFMSFSARMKFDLTMLIHNVIDMYNHPTVAYIRCDILLKAKVIDKTLDETLRSLSTK